MREAVVRVESRESSELLECYASLLKEWNKKINLVSPATIEYLWERHIEDSLQLVEHLDFSRTIIDVGSGGGLPGIVLAIAGNAQNMFHVKHVSSITEGSKIEKDEPIRGQEAEPSVGEAVRLMAQDSSPEPEHSNRIILVESDQRKCIFLREAARVCALDVEITNKRVEKLPAQNAIITARAFKPLPELLKLTRHLGRDYVLLKGEQVEQEIADAKAAGWAFSHALHPSKTGPGYILELTLEEGL